MKLVYLEIIRISVFESIEAQTCVTPYRSVLKHLSLINKEISAHCWCPGSPGLALLWGVGGERLRNGHRRGGHHPTQCSKPSGSRHCTCIRSIAVSRSGTIHRACLGHCLEMRQSFCIPASAEASAQTLQGSDATAAWCHPFSNVTAPPPVPSPCM